MMPIAEGSEQSYTPAARAPSKGEVVSVTVDVAALERECKSAGIMWPTDPSGMSTKDKKLGKISAVKSVFRCKGIADLEGGVGLVPIRALVGYEPYMVEALAQSTTCSRSRPVGKEPIVLEQQPDAPPSAVIEHVESCSVACGSCADTVCTHFALESDLELDDPSIDCATSPKSKQSAASDDVSFALPVPPTSDAWDWPLSREEKKSRIDMIEDQIHLMDRRALLAKIKELRRQSHS